MGSVEKKWGKNVTATYIRDKERQTDEETDVKTG